MCVAPGIAAAARSSCATTSGRGWVVSDEISLAKREVSTAIRTQSSVGSAASLACSQARWRVARSSGIQAVIGSSPGRNGADAKGGAAGIGRIGAGFALGSRCRYGLLVRLSTSQSKNCPFLLNTRAPASGRLFAARMRPRFVTETGTVEWPGEVDLDSEILYGLFDPTSGTRIKSI